MFKYTAHDPESALSVLAAALRLYFASFLYSLTLSVIASLTFLSAQYILSNQVITSPYLAIVPIIGSMLLSLIFFIPLIKRIYSVGADLPITTPQAFSGFFVHFFRMVIFIALCIIASMIIPLLWTAFKPTVNGHVQMLLLFLFIGLYIYIGLKVYFTAMFIILENKPVFTAIKMSFKIEHAHMWLTFCILSLYFLGYWTVISLLGGRYIFQPLGVDLAVEVLSIIALPLFLSIQLCQFFNLKNLVKNSQ